MALLVLTYDTSGGFDGVGAQLQRQAAIFGISKKFNLGYQHSPLTGISWNPNDGMKTAHSRQKQLNDVNRFFSLPDLRQSGTKNQLRLTVSSFTFLGLAGLHIRALLSRKTIVVASQNPYPVANRFRNIYGPARRIWQAELEPLSEKDPNRPALVAIHLRRAAVPARLPNGRPNPRFVPDDWYLGILAVLAEGGVSGPINLEIHSDFDPMIEIEVPQDAPNNSQRHWEELGLSSAQNEFHPPSVDLQPFLSLPFFSSVKLITGLPPLQAMTKMAQSDILLGSRSSMSFVAALIKGSEGKVIFPDFWHPHPPEWFSIRHSFPAKFSARRIRLIKIAIGKLVNGD